METPVRPPEPIASEPCRQKHDAFIARGLAAREEAKRTGIYFDAHEVHDELRAMLERQARRLALSTLRGSA